jgi:hypothetical protein
MSRGLDQMTDAELAQWQYAHRDELEAEEGEPVHAEISPQLSVTLSFRVPGSEADAIREAAHEAGMSMSEWIRQACALAAAPDAAAAQAREARDALDEAGRSIQEAKRRMASEPVRAASKKTVKKATAEKSTKKAAKKSAGKTAAKKSGKKAAKKSTRRAR